MKPKKILIVPLNWGLGHATRLIPIIRYLEEQGAQIILGGSPVHLKLLKQEFTHLETVKISFLQLRLSRQSSQLLSIFLQLPHFIITLLKEHYQLKKIIKEKHIDAVISDNCYGLWNKAIPSVIITHQIQIKVPDNISLLQKIINRINNRLLARFDKCWIPDLPGNDNLGGELSHMNPLKPNYKHIGILSRFTKLKHNLPNKEEKTKKLLVIISGPEMQRTVFENLIRDQLAEIPGEYNYTIIRGLPDSTDTSIPSWYNHVDSDRMQELIIEASCIICRSGYSTIMDLITLGKTAILIPTPGQTEQEYLASYLTKKGLFGSMPQKKFSLNKAIELSQKQRSTTINIQKLSSEIFQLELGKFYRELASSNNQLMH